MKANEAPERIFINPMPSPSDGYVGIAWSEPHSKTIEYIRTDAFIEKACEWLDLHMVGWNDNFVNDFKKAMKGE